MPAGLPPHLDPRQPHFRPPSPSAASVVSVAVHPPASPKYNSMSGLGSVAGSSSSLHQDITDSGEETESFDNGAMTPTLSEEIDDDDDGDDSMDKVNFGQEREHDRSSPTPGPSDNLNPFNFGRINLGGSGGPQVSFSDSVLSRDLDGFTSMSRTARAPSIAATAGSSRAPSARGLSPPASISRGGTTTEGSSLEEYDSAGTGLGESGIETLSMARSQRSSYSAPSSEVEPTNGSVGMEAAGDAATRARGATLMANADRLAAGVSSGNIHEEGEDDIRGAPSLAPSEAGSDSTRSMTQESSSMGHGLYPNPSSGGMAVGGHSSSSDRLANMPSYTSSPGTFEAHSFSDAAVPRGSLQQPVLPSLLAIKRAAGLKRESAATSTAATAGTASPTSSLSVDGDSEAAAPAAVES